MSYLALLTVILGRGGQGPGFVGFCYRLNRRTLMAKDSTQTAEIRSKAFTHLRPASTMKGDGLFFQ
jgi:hypothetical protein